MKKFIFLTSFMIVGVFVFKANQSTPTFDEEQVQALKKWKAYKKVSESSSEYKSTSIEEDEKKILPKEQAMDIEEVPIERKPASKKSHPRKKGRKLIGRMANSTPMMNNPRHDWEDLFVERLINTQAPSTKLFVKHTDSVILANKTQARALEEVIVTFKKQNHSVYSYKAWVDSETGAIVNTWARTQEHKFRQRSLQFSLSGQL